MPNGTKLYQLFISGHCQNIRKTYLQYSNILDSLKKKLRALNNMKCASFVNSHEVNSKLIEQSKKYRFGFFKFILLS